MLSFSPGFRLYSAFSICGSLARESWIKRKPNRGHYLSPHWLFMVSTRIQWSHTTLLSEASTKGAERGRWPLCDKAGKLYQPELWQSWTYHDGGCLFEAERWNTTCVSCLPPFDPTSNLSGEPSNCRGKLEQTICGVLPWYQSRRTLPGNGWGSNLCREGALFHLASRGKCESDQWIFGGGDPASWDDSHRYSPITALVAQACRGFWRMCVLILSTSGYERAPLSSTVSCRGNGYHQTSCGGCTPYSQFGWSPVIRSMEQRG